jgi:endonuclease-8
VPEGDAVRRTAARLDTALAGQRLHRGELRVPRFATVDLAGMTVTGTEVAGKHLLTRLIGGPRPLTLHTHLRMDGRWATGAAGPRPVAGPHHQIRAWLVAAERQAVGLRLGIVEVLATAAEDRITGRLGPDVLGPAFDPAAAAEQVRVQGHRPLAEALLDQQVISGLGTIWTAETAFHAGVSPWTAAADASELPEALTCTRGAMQAGVAARGRRDRPQPWVYGRTGQPCRRCGTAIRAGRVGRPPTDRVTYWCPGCQPGPEQ